MRLGPGGKGPGHGMFLLRLCLHGGNAGNAGIPEQSGFNIRRERVGLIKKVSCGCLCGFVTQPDLFAWAQQDKILRCQGLEQRQGLFPRQSREEMGEQASDPFPESEGLRIFTGWGMKLQSGLRHEKPRERWLENCAVVVVLGRCNQAPGLCTFKRRGA